LPITFVPLSADGKLAAGKLAAGKGLLRLLLPDHGRGLDAGGRGDALTKEMLLLLRDGPAPAKPCEGLMLLLLILLSEGEDIGLLMRGATIGATIRVTIGVTLRRPTRPIGAGATAAAAAAAALPSPPTAGGRNQGKDENRHKDLEGGSRSLSKRTCCI
jgi:hypothetical protein